MFKAMTKTTKPLYIKAILLLVAFVMMSMNTPAISTALATEGGRNYLAPSYSCTESASSLMFFSFFWNQQPFLKLSKDLLSIPLVVASHYTSVHVWVFLVAVSMQFPIAIRILLSIPLNVFSVADDLFLANLSVHGRHYSTQYIVMG